MDPIDKVLDKTILLGGDGTQLQCTYLFCALGSLASHIGDIQAYLESADDWNIQHSVMGVVIRGRSMLSVCGQDRRMGVHDR